MICDSGLAGSFILNLSFTLLHFVQANVGTGTIMSSAEPVANLEMFRRKLTSAKVGLPHDSHTIAVEFSSPTRICEFSIRRLVFRVLYLIRRSWFRLNKKGSDSRSRNPR